MSGGQTRDQEHIGLLGGRPVTNLVQETHRTGRVRQGGETRIVQGGDQEAGRDADGFGNIIVFQLAAVGRRREALPEDGDQNRSAL